MSRYKICSICKVDKPIKEFRLKYDNYYCSYCNDCHREYVRKRSPKRKEYRRINNLKRYGLTLETYNLLFIKQEGKCAICKSHQEVLLKPLFVDHDHNTGKVRGLLCNTCNSLLGHSRDDIKILLNAIEYLRNN